MLSLFDVILVPRKSSVNVIRCYQCNRGGIEKLIPSLYFSTVDEHCTAPKLTLIQFTIEYHGVKWFIFGVWLPVLASCLIKCMKLFPVRGQSLLDTCWAAPSYQLAPASLQLDQARLPHQQERGTPKINLLRMFSHLAHLYFKKMETSKQVASISGSLHQGLRFSSALQSPIVGLSSCRALPAGRPCSPSSTLPPLLQPGLSSLPQLPHRVPRSLASPGDYWPGT